MSIIASPCPPLRVNRNTRGVPLTHRHKLGKRGIDLFELLIGNLNRHRVLGDAADGGGAGDRDDGLGQPLPAGQGDGPVDGQLGWGAALALGKSLDLVDELDVDVKVILAEARVVEDHGVGGDVGALLVLACEHLERC